MTATLVAMLVEEGRLNWTTTLGELFADTVKDMNPAWEKVTLRQVLAHRAGLRRDPASQVWVFAYLVLAYCTGLRLGPDWMRSLQARLGPSKGTLPQQRLEIAMKALSRPPKTPPGTKASYSNVGYILAGVLLENITGRAWEDLMRERLFQPLGILTGGFGPPGTAGKTDQPWGHSWVMGKPLDPGSPSADLPLFYGPAGLAHMTMADWAKFVVLHLRGAPANPHHQAALLKPDTFAELHPAIPARTYFAGWLISTASWARGPRPGDTGRRLWHGGSNGLWNSLVFIAPEIDFAVLVACNRGLDIAGWKAYQAAKALIRAFAPKLTSR